jgi:hypothetical protein
MINNGAGKVPSLLAVLALVPDPRKPRLTQLRGTFPRKRGRPHGPGCGLLVTIGSRQQRIFTRGMAMYEYDRRAGA